MLPDLPHKTKFTAGRQLIPGSRINSIDDQLNSNRTGIVATAAGNALTSVVISNAYNEVTSVAAPNDSVTLPVAKAGLSIGILNADIANSLRVFGNISNGANTIKTGNGAAAAFSDLANGVGALFICFKDGLWIRFTSA